MCCTLILIGSIWVNPCFVSTVELVEMRNDGKQLCMVKIIKGKGFTMHWPKDGSCDYITRAVNQAKDKEKYNE